MEKYCTYIRVSTKRQGDSGLGLEAQRKMCMDYIESQNGELIKEFKDVESGTHRDRPGLWKAIECCNERGCVLVIAKLDRLARDVEFVFKVLNSGIQIYITDMPVVNTMTLGVFASVAQYERELCSSRTKAALNSIKDEIKEKGGHMTKEGRWVKQLGGKRGRFYPGRGRNAGVSASHRASKWRETSALYKWAMFQHSHGIPRKDIIEMAKQMYDASPEVFCTRNGSPLCEGTLSRWIKQSRTL